MHGISLYLHNMHSQRQCRHRLNETVLFEQLVVHIALKGGSPEIITIQEHSDPAVVKLYCLQALCTAAVLAARRGIV